MIQIRSLRDYLTIDNKIEQARKEHEWYPSIQWVLEHFEEILQKRPEKERYNLYFSQYNTRPSGKTFHEQSVIPFDIDEVDPSRPYQDYISILTKMLGLELADVAVIFTGGGYHVLVSLPTSFQKNYITEIRPYYNALCDKMLRGMQAAGLKVKCVDPQFFTTGVAGFRLPGSINKSTKAGREPALVRLLQKEMKSVALDFVALSGLPKVSTKDQLPAKPFRVDTQAVLTGCDFLNFCKEEPNSVSYLAWYAMLSIVGRCEDGRTLSHAYSSGHAKYTPDETEAKLDQALAASGPYTCTSIALLPGWEKKCEACPNFGKVKSPLVIRGPEFIETEESGFHLVRETKTGEKTYKPIYEDLRRFFNKKNPYRIMGGSKICYVWKGTHYELMEDAYIEEFAQKHFKPCATIQLRAEFVKLICASNLTPLKWWEDTTANLINFKNGILNLETGEFGPHTRDRGFRYCLPYDYDPEAQCPQFQKFLTQVLPGVAGTGDRELIDLLLEFAGYSFSGEYPKYQKTLVLTGVGANGKSTFMDILKASAGEDNYSSLDWKALQSPVFRGMMDGKLFNLSEETPEYAWNNNSLFKNLISGGEVNIDVKYKKPYKIHNKTKLIWACNELPSTKDVSYGFMRRLCIIPFDVEFSEARGNMDVSMRDKLFGELSGIFNLIKRGWERLKRQGKFTSASASKTALDIYADEMDHASKWIKDNIVAKPINGGCEWVLTTEAYLTYRNEMENAKENPITNVHFGKRLKKLIPDYDRRFLHKKLNGKTQKVLLDCVYQSDQQM